MWRKIGLYFLIALSLLISIVFVVYIFVDDISVLGNKYSPEGRDGSVLFIGYFLIIGVLGYLVIELWNSGTK